MEPEHFSDVYNITTLEFNLDKIIEKRGGKLTAEEDACKNPNISADTYMNCQAYETNISSTFSNMTTPSIRRYANNDAQYLIAIVPIRLHEHHASFVDHSHARHHHGFGNLCLVYDK